MICCNDEHLKTDANIYFTIFFKRLIHFSICYYSDIPCGSSLEVHPFIIIDAISIILSNENENISNFGEIAIGIVINELYNILGYTVRIDYLVFLYVLKTNIFFFFRLLIFLL